MLFNSRPSYFRPLFVCITPLILLPGLRAGEVELGKYKFRVADGFSIELVAEPPLVKYPICADFDERGRLYVCESSGSIDWNKPQNPDSMHRVLRLEDSNNDGLFDKKSVFAEFEMMAQGSMWLDGSLYVAAAPLIWKLTDLDDDGIADKREEWVKTDKTTGCLNDLRGPYLGHDGYIYWSKGPALQEYLVDGKPWASAARHIMRRHPNGTNSEPLMVGGMDNPIEIAFTPGGQRMITCTYIQPPGAPRDDGILHAIYGGVYPKDIAPIYEFPWTGPDLLTPLTTWGAVSPAGLMCYQSEVFGKEFRGNLFSAHFNGHRVVRHALKPKGGTFECTNEELIGCDNIEFHPTEVMEDADGSLIVIETGGWYRNCCPSSTFYRPDVDGAIYRIRRNSANVLEDPRGKALNWVNMSDEDLVSYLADDRPVVRRRAIEQLARRGPIAIPKIEGMLESRAATKLQKLAGIWTAIRIDSPHSLATIRKRLSDEDTEVRQAAISCLSLVRDVESLPMLLDLLKSGDTHDRRLAAEAIGRLRSAVAVPSLLEALERREDRTLDHALIYALIEIDDPTSVEHGLTIANDNVRRASMIALDQMKTRRIEASSVIAELDSADQALQEAAWWIVSRHPQEWGGLMTQRLREMLHTADANPDSRNVLRARLARLARSPELSRWMVQELTASGVSSSARMLLLQAMGDTGGQYVEPGWVEGLLETMKSSGRDRKLLSEIVTTLSKLPPIRPANANAKAITTKMNDALLATAQDDSLPSETRLRALKSMRASQPNFDEELLDFLLAQMVPDQPLDIRDSAADALSRSKLSEPQKQKVAGSLKNLAVSELSTLLSIFQDNRDERTGLQLIRSLLGSSASDSLNAFRLKTLVEGFQSSAVAEAAKPLLSRLETAQADQLAKAERVAKLIPNADPMRGLQVFNSQKAACIACHKAHNVGGLTGPALKGIGARRSERDLIESVIFPNASIVQSYESWKVLTDDGQVYSGVLIEDKPDEIVLSAGLEKNHRILRSSIEEMTRSEQSIMPTGLDKLITDQEFADIVAFLKSL